MIEFKGECGHSIRARDEDAGRTVRCSYCGRECQVPDRNNDAFDSLFGEVEKTGVFDPAATRAQQTQHRHRRKSWSRPVRQGGEFDPFAVAVRMGGVAVIIMVLAVGWKYGQKGVGYVRDHLQPTPAPTVTATPTSPPTRNDSRLGLTRPKLPTDHSGIYVSSIPADAVVYALSEKNLKGSILENENADVKRKTDTQVPVNPGRYRVAVALPVSTQELMSQPGYPAIRRAIEDELSKPADLSGYFLPDGSTVWAEPIRDEWYLVRVYENVVVFKNQWTAVTALFLPRLGVDGLLDYLPARDRYAFDTAHVGGELDFYEVPAVDQRLVMAALRKVGKIVYRQDENSPYQEFKIRPQKGTLKRTVVKD